MGENSKLQTTNRNSTVCQKQLKTTEIFALNESQGTTKQTAIFFGWKTQNDSRTSFGKSAVYLSNVKIDVWILQIILASTKIWPSSEMKLDLCVSQEQITKVRNWEYSLSFVSRFETKEIVLNKMFFYVFLLFCLVNVLTQSSCAIFTTNNKLNKQFNQITNKKI